MDRDTERTTRVGLEDLAEHGRVYATLLRMAAGVTRKRLLYILAFRLLPPWTLSAQQRVLRLTNIFFCGRTVSIKLWAVCFAEGQWV